MKIDSKERLAELVRRRFGTRKIVVVSNREPVVHVRAADGRVSVLHPASGMTTALVPVVEACGGAWVAHGSGTADFDVVDERDGVSCTTGASSYRVRRVRLSPEIERGYYYGLSNEGLWPLCHIAYTAPLFRHGDWEKYRQANRAFADAVLDEVRGEPAAIFIQDYHLALLPRMLREARPDLLLAQFWHVPWPNREVMRVMPWLDEMLDGLLANDLLGFHVQHHCDNFLDTVDRSVEALVDSEHRLVRYGGHRVYVRPFPISIDAQSYAECAAKRSFEESFPELAASTAGQLLMVGVDRLDYTKGIPHRLRIFESLLDRYPEFRERVTFVQVGAPTRSAIPRYAAAAVEIAGLVEQINARFAKPGGWLPIRYLAEHHERDLLAVLYRRADACLVTSLHDGMNLVAKEYVAAHAGTAGTLLLSKFTGAARELLEACLVNPYDIEGSATMLAESLRLPEATRADAMTRLYERVCKHDVFDWAREILTSLDDVALRGEARRFPGN
jgi:trehalose 6-phosphate synthase